MRRNLIAGWLALVALAGAVTVDDYGSPEWKNEIAGGFLPYRKLNYDDFPVASGIPTPHWMHTEGFFHYNYKTRWNQVDGDATARVSEMAIRSGFDQNKSWKRNDITESKALLEHEQGHLDISELHSADFRKARLPVGSGGTGQAAMDDLKAKLKEIADRCQQEARDEQAKYDNETNHGANEEKQQEWTKVIKKRLEEAKISYWDTPR